MKPIFRAFLLSTVPVSFATLAITAPRKSKELFSEPILVKNSPTNLRTFDVSWNDNSKQRYYLADRTNKARIIASWLIIFGNLRPGDSFPSVRALSRELKINPNTAQKIVGYLSKAAF